MVLLGLLQFFTATILASNIEKVSKERADQIESEVNRQLGTLGSKPTFVYSGSAEAKASLDRINELERIVERQQQVAPPPFRSDKTATRAAINGYRL